MRRVGAASAWLSLILGAAATLAQPEADKTPTADDAVIEATERQDRPAPVEQPETPPATETDTRSSAPGTQNGDGRSTAIDLALSPSVATVADSRHPEAVSQDDQLERGIDGSVRYSLERIEVRGNTRTRSRVILRYLPFRAGDVLDVDDSKITLARYRLLGTGFFRDVQFSLRKGSRPGQVVLVVEVVERNTVVVNGVWLGISADADTHGEPRPLTAYGGADVSENNLAGSGMTLGTAIGLAQNQYALRVRFLDPAFMGTPWMIGGALLNNHATDFFGTSNVLWYSPGQEPTDFAVVDYTRFGGTVGVGRDLNVSSQLWVHYRLETISARPPALASEIRGGVREPIEFDVLPGRSVLSTVRVNLQIDTRDHPFLPTRGWLVSTGGELSLAPLGSDYDYQRFDISASRWWKVPGTRHVARLELFAGAMTGNVPFFEQYYVGDFSDFRPARVLGLNFDRRPPPNFLGTAIELVRYGQYAAEIAGEYRIPVFRGSRSIYGIDFFARGGIFGVAAQRDLDRPSPAYKGWSRIPVDLTANLGFRMDTSAGGLVFSFSNVIGFVPVRGGASQ